MGLQIKIHILLEHHLRMLLQLLMCSVSQFFLLSLWHPLVNSGLVISLHNCVRAIAWAVGKHHPLDLQPGRKGIAVPGSREFRDAQENSRMHPTPWLFFCHLISTAHSHINRETGNRFVFRMCLGGGFHSISSENICKGELLQLKNCGFHLFRFFLLDLWQNEFYLLL